MALTAGLLLVAAAAAADESPELFPDGPGRDEVFYMCTACHGAALVTQQGMSRDRWDETLDVMTQRHGMAPLEGVERAQVIDYLSDAFPPRRRAPANPFLNR